VGILSATHSPQPAFISRANNPCSTNC